MRAGPGPIMIGPAGRNMFRPEWVGACALGLAARSASSLA
jgi:hypothetical protein